MVRNVTTPIESYEALVIPGDAIHVASCGYLDALKEIENANDYIQYKALLAGLLSGFTRKRFTDLYKTYTQLRMLMGNITNPDNNTELARLHMDAFRLKIGVDKYNWQYHGVLNYHSKRLVTELQTVVGTCTAERAMSTTGGTDEGGVTKDLSAGTYSWATLAEAQGGPGVSAGVKAYKRILSFPASTRKTGTEDWLIYAHGSGGGYTGAQTISFKLGSYSSGDPDATYNSVSTTLASGITTSGTVKYQFTKLTGYPSSGSGSVYVFAEMANETDSDEMNLFPLEYPTLFPEVRLWQPGIN